MKSVLAQAVAIFAMMMMLASEVEAHSGGCRKSSPPGKCCHMDKKAGQVHCH